MTVAILSQRTKRAPTRRRCGLWSFTIDPISHAKTGLSARVLVRYLEGSDPTARLARGTQAPVISSMA